MRARRRLTDQELLLRSVPEERYMAQIIEAAEWLGWLVYHPFDSRRDNPGYPDLTLVGKPGGPNAGRLLFIECKRETGTVSTDQLVWIGALQLVREVRVMTARPRDIDVILSVLQGSETAMARG